jgi:hypothetical protein
LLAGLVSVRAHKPKPKPKRQRKATTRRSTSRKSKGKTRGTFGDDEDLLETIFETALGDKHKR